MTLDSQAIETAITENRDLSDGRTRNAHAEQIVEMAEQLGDEARLTEALLNLIDAYEYSSERDKSLVPFARALRRFDAHPEHYDQYDVHTLFWTFKWITSGMIVHPGVSLESIEDWLREMARRYREGGHSLDAVHKGDLIIAMHLGDAERAARAYRQWMDTERDDLSDCYACDLVRRGEYHVELGDDAAGAAAWQPVLDGEHGCKEQPHAVLGDALLPLLRLGRVDEARAAHLRGYRMVRHGESLLATVGEHIEFCALTGNEARALEILAEHGKYLDGVFDQSTSARFQTAAAVLMRRLVASGLGSREVPGPSGRTWTAAELLPELEARVAEVDARFDERNGSTVVSRRTRERLDQSPFPPVRLGTSSPALPAAVVKAPSPVADEAADLDALIAGARELAERGHPRTNDGWLRIAELAAEQGRDLDPRSRADIARARLYTETASEPERQYELIREAAALYTEAGRPDEAGLCEVMAATALLRQGQTDTARERLEAAVTAIDHLFADGAATARKWLQAHVEANWFRLVEAVRSENPEAALTELDPVVDAELARLDERAASGPEPEDLLPIRVSIARFRADVAMRREDPEAVVALSRDCLRYLRQAQRPWQVRTPSLNLAQALLQLGQQAEARETLEAALATEDLLADAGTNAQLHWLLAQLLLAQGDFAETLTHALAAGHWYEASDNPAAAAFNNYLAARAHLGLGRPYEAATILETALPILEADEPEAAVDARFQLISALMAIGEHRGAAEHALAGVEAVNDAERPYEHARYASMAARALDSDGKNVQAVPAYLAAARLWRELGEWPAFADLSRARATLRTALGAFESVRTELAELTEELSAVLAATEPESRDVLRRELALVKQTQAYTVSIHLDREEDFDPARRRHVVDLAREAVAMFEALGPQCLHDRLGVDRQLVFYLAESGDDAAAVAQAQAGQQRCQDAGAGFERHAADFARLAEQFSG